MAKYNEQLKDPRWQKKRLEILGAAEWRCVGCNSAENELHVHHKTYEFGKAPWEYPDYNFQVLCKDCHEEEEYYKKAFYQHVEHLLLSADLNYQILLKELTKALPL